MCAFSFSRAFQEVINICFFPLSLCFAVSYNVHGLDSIHIRVPTAVTLGSAAVLICECDLPDEDLYSVKWYKGKHEFFRYTSKEIPSIKIFPKAGINVNVSILNSNPAWEMITCWVNDCSTG